MTVLTGTSDFEKFVRNSVAMSPTSFSESCTLTVLFLVTRFSPVTGRPLSFVV